MKFSIRDLLLMTVIVALGAAWGVDRSRLAGSVKELQIRNVKLVIQTQAELSRGLHLELDRRAPAPKLPKDQAED